jgi:hypothetical protein
MATPVSCTGNAGHRPTLPLFLYDLSAATRLLPAAAVLPAQFYEVPSRDPLRGEAALMRAVLIDAVACLHPPAGTPSPHARRLAHEAQQWFLAEDDRWPFSFVNICAVLRLDPEYLRRGLRGWQQAPRARSQAGRLPWKVVYRASRTGA